MSENAIVSKECSNNVVYLVPGRLAMNNEHNVSFSFEDEIVINAMLANGVNVTDTEDLIKLLKVKLNR